MRPNETDNNVYFASYDGYLTEKRQEDHYTRGKRYPYRFHRLGKTQAMTDLFKVLQRFFENHFNGTKLNQNQSKWREYNATAAHIYKDLYNSVNDKDELVVISECIENKINNSSLDDVHKVTGAKVREATDKLKSGTRQLSEDQDHPSLQIWCCITSYKKGLVWC